MKKRDNLNDIIGITRLQVEIILFLNKNPFSSRKETAHGRFMSHIDKGIKRLKEKGIVEETKGFKDHRTRILFSLTKKGKEVAKLLVKLNKMVK